MSIYESYTKHYCNVDELQRELLALHYCRNYQVQKVLEVNWINLQLILEFDTSAIPLSNFSVEDLELFTDLMPSIVDVIRHCHRKGWVHGDIKPSNLLYIPSNHHVKLIDFGASYRIGTDRKVLADWQVTPRFASSNQICGEGLVEPKDDWYALRQVVEQAALYAKDGLIGSTLEKWREALKT
ncbi:serine/threonine protein kinase [Vibrionales bacterium SWAT-3]|nr:serine/threonine protein kinase [Vibrionales bacterium SWAT-3]EDK28896.1 serine/threonine protein kinase [Vibrionales bacterium SWAT-3]EDK29181.1 serine/threonine protein kinase [Vibrionales bacterium SWAT-3]